MNKLVALSLHSFFVLFIFYSSHTHAQDTTPPTATISAASSSVISGFASDDVALSRVELVIRNSSSQFWDGNTFGNYVRVDSTLQGDGSWQYAISPTLPPDDYFVVSFPFDSSENVPNNRDSVTFTVLPPDTQPPTATISSANNSLITGLASDNVQVDRVELAIRNASGSYWTGSSFGSYVRVPAELQPNGDWQYQFTTPIPPGEYNVVAFPFDSSENVPTVRDNMSFTVLSPDTQPPTATISSANNSLITGVASDNVSVARIELAIANSSAQFWNGANFGNYERVQATLQNDGSWQYQFSPVLPPDDYIVVAFPFDTSGNSPTVRDNLSFTVQAPDTDPPSATISAADNSNITGTANDNVQVDRIELAIRNSSAQYWNGSSFSGYNRVQATLQNNGNWLYSFSPLLPPDDYIAVAFPFDSSDNVPAIRDTISFTVTAPDTVPPTATIVGADANLVSGIATDNIALDRVELAIANSSAQYWNGSSFGSYDRVLTSLQSDGSWEYLFSPSLPPDDYTIVAFPFDTAGNAPTVRDSLTYTVSSITSFISEGSGSWGNPIGLPSVPVSAANLPDGRILTWSGQNRFSFQYGVDNARTYTVIFNPTTGSIDETLVSNANHDMFCPGANMLADGRIMVTGGSSVARTSIFNPATESWSQEDVLNIPRAYNANTTLQDGSVLTLGGSWAEETLCRTGISPSQSNCPDKLAEVWNPSTGWSVLSGISADTLRTNDVDGLFRSDNHMWLFGVEGNKVLHAGPSKAMHLLDVAGNGSISPVGNRADDNDAMNGNAVMYDIGKVLTLGGAPDYENVNATNNAFVVEVDGSSISSRRTGSMNFSRAYHNSVVLPNGEVIVVGGQSFPVPFSDNNSVFAAELWNPELDTFRTLATMSIPRNYHSFALLLTDGRVIAGGGGLCGSCSTNHPDVEIFTPPYLLDANGNPMSRPGIVSSPASTSHGQSINIQTNKSIASVVLIRAAVGTHSVNNDQRRIPLSFSTTGTNNYNATIPSDPGIAIPGDYMLFVLDDNGTPSISRLINVN